MRVLVACEYSGRVREAFRARGHDAWSCDLLPSEDNSPFHIQGDALKAVREGRRYPFMVQKEHHNAEECIAAPWDLMICHPPCTALSVSGARWWKEKRERGEQQAAVAFARALWEAPIERVAMENPISYLSTAIRKPDQIIQPWQFGHGETKATCLWLKNLPLLRPTNIVDGREARVHKMPPGPDRWKERSRTYLGIAKAMAEQWG